MGRMKRPIALAGMMLLAWALTSVTVPAADYTSTIITSNNYTNSAIQINSGGQIVWQGFDGEDYEIFTYKNGAVTQLTNNTCKDYNPSINRDGDIAWSGYDGKDYEIYLYRNNSISQVTNNKYSDYNPQINDNGQIVWYSYDGVDLEICTCANNTVTYLTSNNYQDFNPKINKNGDVAWYGYDGKDFEIYLYRNNCVSQVTDNNYNDYDPEINDNGQIVWRYLDGQDYEIGAYINGVVKPLTSNSYHDYSPKISENGDIVWYGIDGKDTEIYLYHNNTVSQITNNSYRDYFPQINQNGQIVWYGSDGRDYEIYTYVNGVTTLLTNDSYNDYHPQLNDDGCIVWYKSMGSTNEIYLAQPTIQGNLSRYDFSFYYGDNSGDYFTGYFYTAPGSYKVGDIINPTVDSYYRIADVTTGYFDMSYNDTAYINSYYDGDTRKISNTLDAAGGQKQTGTSLKITNLLAASSYLGYVYDPGVPLTDLFFGDGEVTYQFGPNRSVNFMAVYISDLPYWNQPGSYPGSCSEIAAAIILSYWDRNGYDNMIATDWETYWPDNTSSVSSYVDFIGTLAQYLGYPATPSGGTYTSKIGPGMDNYALNQGYADFSYKYYTNSTIEMRTANWASFKNAIDTGHPVLVNVNWSAGGHSTVGRGYWNDGKIATNYGWGTYYDNEQLDWNRSSGGSDYNTASIYSVIDLYDQATVVSGGAQSAPTAWPKVNVVPVPFYPIFAGSQDFLTPGWCQTQAWNDKEKLIR